jgi:hypothetical protein
MSERPRMPSSVPPTTSSATSITGSPTRSSTSSSEDLQKIAVTASKAEWVGCLLAECMAKAEAILLIMKLPRLGALPVAAEGGTAKVELKKDLQTLPNLDDLLELNPSLAPVEDDAAFQSKIRALSQQENDTININPPKKKEPPCPVIMTADREVLEGNSDAEMLIFPLTKSVGSRPEPVNNNVPNLASKETTEPQQPDITVHESKGKKQALAIQIDPVESGLWETVLGDTENAQQLLSPIGESNSAFDSVKDETFNVRSHPKCYSTQLTLSLGADCRCSRWTCSLRRLIFGVEHGEQSTDVIMDGCILAAEFSKQTIR